MESRDNIFSSHLGRAPGPAQAPDMARELALRAMFANNDFQNMAAAAAIAPPQNGGGIMSKLVAALAQPESEQGLSHSNRGIVQNVTLPTVMHSLLSEPSLSSVISWLPQGKIWRINDVCVFEKLILPVFFQNILSPNTLSSFFEALKEWGFDHLAVENNAVAFHSRFFVQDAPLLSLMMRRTPPYQAPAPQAQITAGLLQLLQNPSDPGALSIAPSILAQHTPEAAQLPNTNERAFNKLLCILNQQQTLAAGAPEKPAASRPIVVQPPAPETSVKQEPRAPSNAPPAPANAEASGSAQRRSAAVVQRQKDEQTNMEHLSIAKFLISQASSPGIRPVQKETRRPVESSGSASPSSSPKLTPGWAHPKMIPKKRAGKKKFLPPKAY